MLSMGIFYFYSLVYMLVHVNEVYVCLTFFGTFMIAVVDL